MDAPDVGPLEMRLLGLLDAGEPRSVSDLQAALRRDGTDLAYTTVMTVLSRLHAKGLVTRRRESRRFVYSPAPDAGLVKHSILARVRRGLFRSDRLRPIVALLDDEELTRDELEALQGLIRSRLREERRR